MNISDNRLAWGERPHAAILALFYAAYVAAGGFGQGLAIIPGVAITFWPPAGIFLATLLLSPRSLWPWHVATACLAELTCNAIWFHNPTQWALVYFAANALEALTAAWLIERYVGRPFRLDSPRQLLGFVLMGAVLAPCVGATIIASTDALLGKHAFFTAWPLVWLGDGTGLLISTPLTYVTVRAWRGRTRIPTARMLEAAAIVAVLLAGCVLAFRGQLPTAYLLVPVLIWAAMRFHMPGAAASMALLTVATAWFTVSGKGEFAGDPQLLHARVIMLQTFLAVCAVTTFCVAALAAQHQDALHALHDANRKLEARVVEGLENLHSRDRQLRLFIEHAPVAIAMFDRQMRCIAASRKWQAQMPLGVKAGHDDTAAAAATAASGRWWQLCEQAFAGHTIDARVERLERSDGSVQWVQWDLRPWHDADGKVGGVLIAAEDVSERMHLQNEREAHIARLEEAERRKDEFLAMLAHELRNPLAPIATGARLLEQTADAAQLRRIAAIIDRQSGHLARLVDDLLDVSRVTQNKIQLVMAPADVTECIQRAVEQVRPLVDEKGHALHVGVEDGGGLWVRGDTTRLAQVLCNLLNNAAKYTPPGGRIALTARAEDDEVVVSVQDDGPGIAPALLTCVFDLFVQGQQQLSRSEGGLGLGLPLVRKLTELHGGSVSAYSAGVGQGSTFTVRLPRGEPAQAQADGSRRAGRARRVLVVDDNHDSADSLGLLLELGGHVVDYAYDGQSALRRAADLMPEVVLLDIGLPGMDGYAVARQLRRDTRAAAVTLIAVTGYGQEEDKARARDAGFDHHLTKPVDPVALEALLAVADRVS